MLDRRGFLISALAAAGCREVFAPPLAPSGHAVTRPPAGNSGADETAFGDLERDHGGRLGISALDLQTGMRVEHRADERFLACSTVKTPLVAFTLRRVDLGLESLDRAIGAMTVRALCEAAITISDNTAGNLLFEACGGPRELTGYLRGLGDTVSHFDRLEPALNDADAQRDTTTARAMVDDLQKLFVGDALSPTSRELFRTWHFATSTGPARLRAGLPADWQLAHKTGTNDATALGDIGVAFPPDRAPVIIAVYYDGCRSSLEVREAVIAQVARICIS